MSIKEFGIFVKAKNERLKYNAVENYKLAVMIAANSPFVKNKSDISDFYPEWFNKQELENERRLREIQALCLRKRAEKKLKDIQNNLEKGVTENG